VTLRLAAVQHDIVWESPSKNFTRLAPQIARAVGAGGQLVVLTEMFSTGFTMDSATMAESLDGPSAGFLQAVAAEHEVWICGSIPTRWNDGVAYNTLTLAGPDGELHRYKKIHPFTYSAEPENYGAGTEFLHVTIDGVRVTFFVCYDLRFADEFWATARDTDLFVVPANWPERRRVHWRSLLHARAIENQAYVAGVNRVGEGDGLPYSGDSMVIDPWGEVLVSGASSEALLVVDIDPAVVAETRASFPVFEDRRTY
jgi:predicted amidohydrolase